MRRMTHPRSAPDGSAEPNPQWLLDDMALAGRLS
jgi:hypothetical protein